jgi:hypothetical protein
MKLFVGRGLSAEFLIKAHRPTKKPAECFLLRLFAISKMTHKLLQIISLSLQKIPKISLSRVVVSWINNKAYDDCVAKY